MNDMRERFIHIKLLWSIYVIFSFISCRIFERKEKIKDIYEIKIKPIVSIGSEGEDVLLQWAGVAADKDNNIYVSDTMDYSIKKFDSQGKLIKKVGRKGQGVGEFSAPRCVAVHDDRVYITDQYLKYIQVFNIDLEYLSRIPITYPINDLEVVSDNLIFVSSWNPPDKHILLSLDNKGDITEKIELGLAASKDVNNSINFTLDEEGNFYISYNFVDLIEKMDSSRRVVWRKELFKGIKVELENKYGFMLPSKYIYKDIVIDRHDRIFILGGSYSENKSRDVYVLDTQGEHIGTLTLPDTTHCIYLDTNDKLYSRANEGMTLLKMEIIF